MATFIEAVKNSLNRQERQDQVIGIFNAKALSRRDAKMDDQKNQIVQIIKDAFADTPYPKDNQIGESHEIDFIDEYFKGKKWQDISVETLFKCRTDLMYFTDYAFRYFLPAFMIGIILHEAETDTLATNLIMQLTPPSAYKNLLSNPNGLGTQSATFLSQTKLFDVEEVQATISFLNFYADSHSDDSYAVQNTLIEKALLFWESRVP